ncbi:hypothetical protein [Alistipes sp.]|uniref:hypothetical protein n=1 Tax=Alistipes sp. TaxID=1872444 RepID=UPI003AB39B02
MKKILLSIFAVFCISTFATAQKISYQGEVLLGYSVGVGDEPIDRIPLHIVNGVRFNDYLSMGIGVGIEYWCYFKGFMEHSTYTIPVYANIKGYLPVTERVSPFVGLDLGYGIGAGEFNAFGGFLATPVVGVSFGVKRNFAINLSVGYAYQKMSEGTILNDASANGLTIKVGFQF